MLDQITPLIITLDEAPNLRRTLERLDWAKRIVVVDSFSTDETLEILLANPRIEIFQRPFESFASQCNFGLKQIRTEWVLSLDADYVLTDEFIDEMRRCPSPRLSIALRRASGIVSSAGHLAELYTRQEKSCIDEKRLSICRTVMVIESLSRATRDLFHPVSSTMIKNRWTDGSHLRASTPRLRY